MSALWALVVIIFLAATLIGWITLHNGVALWGRYRATFTESAKVNLAEMFLFIDPAYLFRANAVALIVVPGLLWLLTGQPVIAVLAALVIAWLPRRLYRYLKQRRLRRFEHQLPDAMMMVAGSLRAGASLPSAMEGLVRESYPPLSQEFALMLREQRFGVDFDTALVHAGERLPVADFQLVVAAIRIAREVGGNLTESMESLADAIRRKQMLEGKIRALTAQGRLQGIVMASMPMLIAVALLYLQPQLIEPLFHSRLGWAVVAVIAVMEYLGYRMIRKILDIDI